MKNPSHGICPWQAGSLLTTSLRALAQNPRRILRDHLAEGITAIDVGCGMGYFSIPIAEMIGSKGKMVAVDLQPEMLDGLKHRAAKKGCDNIVLHPCGKDTLALGEWTGKASFVLIFYMLHEVPDRQRLIRELYTALANDGKLFFAEPIGHVSAGQFKQSLDMITAEGFKIIASPKVAFSRAALLMKDEVKG